MLRGLVAVAGVLIFSNAFASEFKIVSEQRIYTKAGVLMPDELLTVSEYSLKSSSRSSFDLVIRNKIVTKTGEVFVDQVSRPTQYSPEQVRSLSSIYSLCSVFKGELETITVKAGTFKACKRQLGDATLWSAEGFPFEIKSVIPIATGVMIREATEVTILP